MYIIKMLILGTNASQTSQANFDKVFRINIFVQITFERRKRTIEFYSLRRGGSSRGTLQRRLC